MDAGRVFGKKVNGRGLAGGPGCNVCYGLVEVNDPASGLGPAASIRKDRGRDLFRKSLNGSRDHKKQKEIDYSSESPCTTRDMQEKEGILPERAEEAKLKAKYPSLGQKPGGSDFLMKRLQKGQKYFDSGDYNMAKAKMKNKQLPSAGPDKNLVTGDHIPTPQDLPQRKSSLVTSKLAGGQVE
nr:PREDICTED: alpha-endosulfine isoform X1 [Macaca fascicularis]